MRAGRPPLYTKKLERVILYITKPQLEYLKAQTEFTSPSQFIRRLLEAVI